MSWHEDCVYVNTPLSSGQQRGEEKQTLFCSSIVRAGAEQWCIYKENQVFKKNTHCLSWWVTPDGLLATARQPRTRISSNVKGSSESALAGNAACQLHVAKWLVGLTGEDQQGPVMRYNLANKTRLNTALCKNISDSAELRTRLKCANTSICIILSSCSKFIF